MTASRASNSFEGMLLAVIFAMESCLSLASTSSGVPWMPLITIVAAPGTPNQTRACLGPHKTPKKGHFSAAPHPSYPTDAVRKKIEGIGVFEVHFRCDGSVSHVAVFRSTGHWILDKECISTFKGWRCDPGSITWFRVPVRFAIETK